MFKSLHGRTSFLSMTLKMSLRQVLDGHRLGVPIVFGKTGFRPGVNADLYFFVLNQAWISLLDLRGSQAAASAGRLTPRKSSTWNLCIGCIDLWDNCRIFDEP